mmetsp:Transcript_24148/g.44691  ORF Transcript_24148/g.44691 Transcript_24148/m.44691 type:complete len:95 (+) Transcript_24148:410-694(+)
MTAASVVKNLPRKGIMATNATSAAPKIPPAPRKETNVRRSASARARHFLPEKIGGTKLCAVRFSESQTGVRQQKKENKICCAAISIVPSADDAT